MVIAELVVMAVGIYAAFGVTFALAFVTTGVSRVDHSAKGSSTGFRVAIFPGTAALWPLLLLRWMSRRDEAPVERNNHRVLAEREGQL